MARQGWMHGSKNVWYQVLKMQKIKGERKIAARRERISKMKNSSGTKIDLECWSIYSGAFYAELESKDMRRVGSTCGDYDTDRKIEDLKLLYRAYVSECFPNGCVEEEKIAALNDLKNVFVLGKREAEAAFLPNLCEELNFDPEKANEIHEEIYRTKLHQFVPKGELSEDEVAALSRLRVLFCIPRQTIDMAHADMCGLFAW